MAKSIVWNYFSVKATDESIAICNSCECDIKRGGKDKRTFSTTNLQNHLRRKHDIVIVKNRVVSHTNPVSSSQSEDDPGIPSTSTQISFSLSSSSSTVTSSAGVLRQPTLMAIINKTKKFGSDDPRSKEITKKIAEMVCTDSQPFSVVEDIGFRRLISHLEPRYHMVTRQHLANTVIPDMYEKLKCQVMNVLATAENIAVTSDIWTSVRGHDYLSVTVHFIKEDWALTELALEVILFEGASHTAALVVENWETVFYKWGLSNKIVAIVTDGATNMKLALSSTHLPVKGLTCNIHTLQLVLKDSCFIKSSVANLVSNCKKIVTHFHHSTNSSKILRQTQASLGLPQHELVQDEPTRWNSTFHMLQRLCEQRTAIAVATASISLNLELTNSDWVLAENLVKILKLFDEATHSLSSSKATLGDVIPIITSLKCATEKFSTIQGLGCIVRDIKRSLDTRFGHIKDDPFYLIATAVDPRYKIRAFQEENSVKLVKEELLKAMTIACTGLNDNIPNTKATEINTAVTSVKEDSLWAICEELMSESDISSHQPFPSKAAENELTQYLSEPNLSISDDIFNYWHHSQHFKLRSVARKFLGIPPSTVNSERLFSVAGDIADKKRNRLQPQTLQKLMFLKKNLTVFSYTY